MAGLLSRLIQKVRDVGRGLFRKKPQVLPAPQAREPQTGAPPIVGSRHTPVFVPSGATPSVPRPANVEGPTPEELVAARLARNFTRERRNQYRYGKLGGLIKDREYYRKLRRAGQPPGTPGGTMRGLLARSQEARGPDGQRTYPAVPAGEGLPDIPRGWVDVQSSHVARMFYHPEIAAMDIQYRGGTQPIVRYFNISKREALYLFTQSHGIHVWDIVRYRGKGNKHKHRKPWMYMRR